MRQEHKKLLEDNGVFILWSATGSRVIQNPPPIGRDEDWIVLVDDMSEAMNLLMGAGFGPDAQKLYGGVEFVSFRKGLLNLIITEQLWLYDRYVLATEVAKKLNLQSRNDRVRLFQTIREVNRPNSFIAVPVPRAKEDGTVPIELHPLYWDNSNVEGGY